MICHKSLKTTIEFDSIVVGRESDRIYLRMELFKQGFDMDYQYLGRLMQVQAFSLRSTLKHIDQIASSCLPSEVKLFHIDGDIYSRPFLGSSIDEIVSIVTKLLTCRYSLKATCKANTRSSRNRTHMIGYAVLVQVVEFDPITLVDGDRTLKFRLEVFRHSSRKSPRFYGHVVRLDYYRLQPSFPQRNGRPLTSHQCDEEVLHIDREFFDGPVFGNSSNEVIEKVITILSQEV